MEKDREIENLDKIEKSDKMKIKLKNIELRYDIRAFKKLTRIELKLN